MSAKPEQEMRFQSQLLFYKYPIQIFSWLTIWSITYFFGPAAVQNKDYCLRL